MISGPTTSGSIAKAHASILRTELCHDDVPYGYLVPLPAQNVRSMVTLRGCGTCT